MTLPVFDPPNDLTFAKPFWDAAERGEFVLPRCSICRRWQWYPDLAGPDCSGATLVWETLSGTGTVYTWTRIHRPFLPGHHLEQPYNIVLVELDGADGPRIIGNLAGDQIPRIGMAVSLNFERIGTHNHPVFVTAT